MENSNDSVKNNVKIIGALLVGAAIGGALGILFAPAKGSETRKKIMGETEDLAETLKDKTESLKDKIDELLDEAKKEFDAIKEKSLGQNHNHDHTRNSKR